MFPDDRRYTVEHEWVRADGGEGTMGITSFAQGELGDIVFVELPPVGRQVQRGDVLGTVESVKAVSEIYAPVAGVVSAVNALLADQPELLNTDPHGAGWYCKLRLSDPSEVTGLLDAAAYQTHVGK
ncbi:MAG TPA: glycine cleavage system protein GcvH [Candidatus Polarisedimenticolaceae bacterium]|nr:glycine cleavage system protein GcvH [Candidatus Polarisedimenticolaceae bacterium]